MNQFDEWNEVKKFTHSSKVQLTIKPRDIFWTKIWQNIGHEEYGKGKDFLRPVIVIRQLTSDLFIGIPTTTSDKQDNNYFHNIVYVDKNTKVGVNSVAMLLQMKVFKKVGVNSVAMLLQMKVFNKKRLFNKLGTISQNEFTMIIDKLKDMIDPT